MAHVHLLSSLRQCSAHLLSSLRQCSAVCGHTEQGGPFLTPFPQMQVYPASVHLWKQWSLTSPSGPDFFPYFLPASCVTLTPFSLSSHNKPQSSPWGLTSKAPASAPSPNLTRPVSRQMSQAGECWSAPILCAGISLLFPPHTCYCTLL